MSKGKHKTSPKPQLDENTPNILVNVKSTTTTNRIPNTMVLRTPQKHTTLKKAEGELNSNQEKPKAKSFDKNIYIIDTTIPQAARRLITL
jgi:hypothetical protein